MGRAHLSSRFGIDAPLSARSPVPQLPKYVDAPFDLDADVLDGPDVVYEAFLTSDEIRQREDTPLVVVTRENAPSPVESIESDESGTTTTDPLTRVPSPSAQDRGSATRPSSPGMDVLNLLEPLTDARSAALPALQAALATNTADIGPLVLRLIAILRPHIIAALDPFRQSMPDVDFLGHMFEFSLILDLLPAEHPTLATFPRAVVLAALEAAEGFMPHGTAMEEPVVREASSVEYEPGVQDEPFVVDEADDDDTVSDPGMDEEDLVAEVPYTNSVERSVTGWWTGQDSSRVDWPHHRPTNRPVVAAPVIAPQIIGTRSSSRASTPSVMDADTDDELSSRSSSSMSSRISSVYRSNNLSFAPRIVRAHSATTRPYPSIGVATGRGYTDRFVPVERLRPASPLR
ncbi:hypothetical protein FRB94_009801 [Tulasnella sp. JGI-2019a]|nr:hypothetical protein FRB93_002882 [Tulasnella sp. JGI-2019a]KAG8994554.1 hypothetical protein FRB94_009801 [Tulasnella sp. JGI-2019a]KAG9024911.1 hypothetical protein FRB95_010882 [Tulasnella sp. JGI-2019a]